MKKIYKKVSVFSRFINIGFKFTDAKKNYESASSVKKFIRAYQNKVKKYNLYNEMGFSEEKIGEDYIYTYNGTLEKNTGRILLYIHGGSFVEEAISYQLKFAIEIALKTQSTLIVPRYKLIPNGNYKNLYSFINNVYDCITNATNDFNFLGDSSGGGFILAYSMYLRDQNKLLPKNLLMLSPWLDLSMENPELIKMCKKDNLSNIGGNQYCGKLWADDLDVKNPLVSPIYGSFNNLPKITLMTGSYDIMKPECLRLGRILDAQTIDYNYIEYKFQGHDFACYPTKEGKLSIQDMVDIVNGE